VAEGRWRLVRARRDAVPASVRRFGARARRNRLRTARPALIAAAVVVLLGAAFSAVWFTPVFAVRAVRVQGTAILADSVVRAAAGVVRDTPLLRVDPGRVRRRLLGALPPVRRATVTRQFPSTVVIRVAERTPAAVVERPDGLWLMDASGVPYLPAPNRPGDLSLVKLRTPGPADPSTRGALTVLAALPPQLRAALAALVADAPARIRLELTDGRTVVWGDATENDAKIRVTLVLLARPGKVLDVSAPALVTIR
jgi:cell division protein FtsQ